MWQVSILISLNEAYPGREHVTLLTVYSTYTVVLVSLERAADADAPVNP